MSQINNINDVDFLKFVSTQESQFMVGMAHASAEIHERFRGGVSTFGDTLPWPKTHDIVRLRPGEVSLWCGINGHGKSMVTSHVAASLMLNRPVTIASLEMPIAATGHRMLRQIGSTSNPTPKFIDEMIEWTHGKLWVYDQLDTVKSERILGMVIYAASELGCGHVFIDSLMKCGVRQDDLDGQSEFVNRLCWAAKAHQVHVHLVHHMRKGESEEKIPDKFDVKGSGTVTDMVDNLFIVHRNKKKERDVAASKPVEEMCPDTVLRVGKQRHGEWEGDIALWFDKDSQQFIAGPNSMKQRFEIPRH